MMEHKTIKILSIVLMMGGLSSCYYDVEEELYPTIECQTENMSYADDIIPIISTNCYACHASNVNFGNVTLDSHTDISVHVDNGRLMGSINHQSGFSPMPQNANKLLDCEIEKIESWIVDGAPDN